MKKILLSLIFQIVFLLSFGQSEFDKITDSIFLEGKTLYKSEMASWYGTDIFLEKYTDRKNIGGYLSYFSKENIKCIFFSKNENPKIIGTITFDSTYNVNKAKVDINEREFTKEEIELYTIRKNALSIINTDTLFKRYSKTDLNLIPIILNGERKVYVLTGPQENGAVIFGNDYLLQFGNNNQLTNKRSLHNNIMFIPYSKEGTNVTSVHSHLPETGDFITATDVCTLMLYEKIAKWKQHLVISEKIVSIWDCEKNKLLAITKQAWAKIYKDTEE